MKAADILDEIAMPKADGYHTGGLGSTVQRGKYVDKETREFIAWDGEGCTPVQGKPQHYVLFGCSKGDRIIKEKLRVSDCLSLIIKVGRKYPHAWHIGFAFDYDVNMILRGLSSDTFRRLRQSDRNTIKWGNYVIQHVPGKWFRVTEYGEDGKFTVTINDLFGFFQSSFVKAVRKWIDNKHPKLEKFEIIEKGKANRPYFQFHEIDLIEEYWEVEISVLQLLAESLRAQLYSVDLNISKWHGPGAIANHVYTVNGIANHKAETPMEVYDASRYGYAGGRFEMFRLGRFTGPIYGMDINSAYPFAIAHLPSLSEGHWKWVDDYDNSAEFAIWRVRYYRNSARMGVRDFKTPGPTFFRNPRGAVSFPWNVDGWYWNPEVDVMHRILHLEIEVIGGWVFEPFSDARPFAFVEDMYEQRRIMKAVNNAAEKAIKLALNSLYGKMAQRAGWKAAKGAPAWHQLEWAGYVTSVCRAMILIAMACLGFETIIGVETDGIYTTRNPASLKNPVKNSKNLGEWEVTVYDEIMYLQSGMYAKRVGSNWDCKYRGLDSDTLSPESIGEYLQELRAIERGESWPTFARGSTTRFVGYSAALKMQGPFRFNHAVWRKSYPEINPAVSGKRSHSPVMCRACKAGKNAYEMPHDMVISSEGTIRMHPRSDMKPWSTPHDIPWLDSETSEWREAEEMERGLLGIG
jgi:hypothetical protein